MGKCIHQHHAGLFLANTTCTEEKERIFIYSANCDHYKFYNTQTNSVVNDPKPFAKTDFEPSPLNRVLRQGSPGLAWQPGTDPATDRSVKMGYGTNTANEVIIWKVSGDNVVNGGYYASSTLYKTTSWDENNQVLGTTSRSEEFKDLQGKVVLKRSYNGTEKFLTYYVYDDSDQLCFVLTPKAMENDALEANELDDLCYRYTYDYRKRMNGKKLPGADWVYMVYDKRDRLVATQDGVQRLAYRWLVTKYDYLNRPVITASLVLGDTPSALETYLKDYPDSYSYYESRNGSSVGYTLDGSFSAKLSLTEADILSVTYYDNYSHLGLTGFSSVTYLGAYDIDTYVDNDGTANGYFDRVKGLVTGTKTKVLDGNEYTGSAKWLCNASYYDDSYRVIQNRRSLYDGASGGVETMASLYDFPGKLTQAKQVQTFGALTTSVDKFYTYDHAGRLTKTEQQISGDTQNGRVTIAENTYNEIGQLVDKKLHKTASGTYLQSVDYTYNIRGWLTGINNPDNLSSLQAGDPNIDLYGQRLLYDTPETNLTTSTQLQFNGNISAMVWNTSEKSKQGYGFTYDGLSRLKESDHKDFGTYWADNSKYEEKSIIYDLNGNIKTLVRTDNAGGTMASYSYTYSGNQLASINGGAAYGYDKNGNATTDGLRGMQVAYNQLNLPKSVSKGTDNIAYIYSAQGEKLAKKMKDNSYQYYAGNMVYKNDKSLNYLLMEEGMVNKSSGGYVYEYHLKDHLGNVRVTFQPDGSATTVTQATEYYPFGMNYMPHSPAGSNKYLYNGKEKQDDVLSATALDWYDYGARFYDAQIGRWHSRDGKAEIYVNMTPYCYAANTPINAIDPDGDVVVFINGFSYGGEGGTRKYWQKTETQTRSVRYTDGFGRSLWSGNEKQNVVTSDFAKSFCEKFGEDVNKAKFFDGAPLDFSYPLFRMGVGYVKGKLNVEEIIKGLARTGGVITEPLIMATHSMGGIYGRGFLDAVLEYVKNNPGECKGLSISVYDFDPYQAKYMEEVHGVSITQIIHDGTVAEQEEQGTDKDGKNGSIHYIDDTKNSNSHSIASFIQSFKKLGTGKYIWDGNKWVKI